jgi:pimeloyl-ACP methyl ester carboxylesterase
MPRAPINGIEIEYELSGPEDGQPLLCVHGLGSQLIHWPEPMVDGLGAAGFRVIRFDNRDVGLSTHFHGVPVPDIMEVIEARRRGEKTDAPYTISDMAADALGLLDLLGIERAHILGASMGGLIAQALTIANPHRALSLNIIMSHPGDPDLRGGDPAVTAKLATPAPDPREDEEGFARHQAEIARAVGSPGYPPNEAFWRSFAVEGARRAFDPSGVGRQMAATRSSPEFTEGLRGLDLPTLVIHGMDDPLVSIEGGRAIAANVRNALLLQVNGMGHDFPAELLDMFVSAIAANTRRKI